MYEDDRTVANDTRLVGGDGVPLRDDFFSIKEQPDVQ
jgi:hypothetical protein